MIMPTRFELLVLPIIAFAVAVFDGGSTRGDRSVNGSVTRDACPPQPAAFCFHDSAYYREGPRDPYGMPQQDWIVFGGAGDSVDLLAGPQLHTSIQTNRGDDLMPDRSNAPYFRRRLVSDGVVAATVFIDVNSDTDPYPYWLRVSRTSKASNAPPALTGARATIIARSGSNWRDSFSIVPVSMVSRVKNLSNWKVPAGTWVVALVRDSLYDVCYKRCVHHDTIRLRPFQRVTIAR